LVLNDDIDRLIYRKLNKKALTRTAPKFLNEKEETNNDFVL